MSKKTAKSKMKSVEIEGVSADDALAPMEKDTWRLIVDFKNPMAGDVKGLADKLGINWQATVKVLVEEALTARREREARIRGAS